MRMLKEVVARISPSVEERRLVAAATGELIDKINKNLKYAKAVLGGSGAKDTWLAGGFDVDVFVQFDYEKYKGKSGELSDLLERHLKKSFSGVMRLHGSRDYFRIKNGKFSFEVVPVLRVSKAGQSVNITDVSLLHVAWVNRRISGLEDDVRLMKAFCRANGCYGAESYIRGFSGYACEVLVLHYGSFLGVLRSAVRWAPGIVIDPERYYKSRSAVLMGVNRSKREGPLLLVDPVQRDRNVAAALSREKFNLFVNAAKKFLKKPSAVFFEEKVVTTAAIIKKYKNKKVIIVKVKPKTGKPDVVGAKLLKAFDFVRLQLLKNDFRVISGGWNADFFWFVFDRKPLSATTTIQGPPLRDKVNVDNFRKKYKKTIIRKGRMSAATNRKFRVPEQLVKTIINDDYFKEKVSAVSVDVF